MRCPRVQRIIALSSSDDATTVERHAASRHLAVCENCKRFAEAELPPLTNYRSTQPLDDADFASIRAAVMNGVTRVDERRSPTVVFRLAFAAAALAMVLIGFLVMRSPARPAVDPGTAGQSTMAAGPSPAVETTAAEPAVAAPAAAVRPDEPEVARHTQSARVLSASNTASSPDTSAPDDATPIRIELQTSDPDVRIIWLANQTWKPENDTTPKEDS